MSEASHTIDTDEASALGLRLGAIFLPHAKRQTERFYTDKGEIKATARFVHYTTAEAALKIIESKRVWMRNTKCMADYSEVQHGFEMLQRFFADATKKENSIRRWTTYPRTWRKRPSICSINGGRLISALART